MINQLKAILASLNGETPDPNDKFQASYSYYVDDNYKKMGIYFWTYTENNYTPVMYQISKTTFSLSNLPEMKMIKDSDMYFQLSLIHDFPYGFDECYPYIQEIADKINFEED